MDTIPNKEEVFLHIKDLVNNNRVVLFMKGTQDQPQCGFSSAVAHILKFLGVTFKDVNVFEHEGMRSALKEFSNWPTFPQLYIDGQLVGGSDITRAMFESGELKTLLASKGLIQQETQ